VATATQQLTARKIKKIRAASHPPKSFRAIPKCMREMMSVRNMKLWTYLLGLAEADYDEYRKLHRNASSPLPPRRIDTDSSEPKRHGGGGSLSPEQVQVALHLHTVEHVPISELAARFNCGRSTIRRCFAFYAERKHTREGRPGPNRGCGRAVDQRRRRNAG
jgi:hypothetical protein